MKVVNEYLERFEFSEVESFLNITCLTVVVGIGHTTVELIALKEYLGGVSFHCACDTIKHQAIETKHD